MGSKTLKSQKPAAKRTHAYVGRGAYAVTPGGIAAMRSVAPEVADTIETTSASGIPSRTISPSALEALKARIARDARPVRPELAAIALEHLQIETLEERRSDALDFHDVGVLGVRDALDAAFEAGRKSAALSAEIARLNAIPAGTISGGRYTPAHEFVDAHFNPDQRKALAELFALLEDGTTIDGVTTIAPAGRVVKLIKAVRS